ncbi:MAG: sulfite exporter TauE/SafE family protein [Acidobacteria bacterium]|nr:MAG: sulfite exporter TauE/SafE family protein [Acidobacteriota bacterium]REK02030.1 MAG: sulfite exporter TauE/SafE family protein [Acidobacteriota bacterium]REK14988.1 MAG: sulfite exporter TauE/SafE family protein [Acidobacteriota bacterium]REK45702.1 MAG: sulfite exporter TauE/SafE family protein [Acidobacteriota bacterium]
MEYLSYILAAVIGVSLGLIGAGGSILTVPVLVYLAGVDPVLATAYSLFVVGSTALVGGFQNFRKGLVDLRTVAVFGAPAIATVYLTRAFVLPAIPATVFEIDWLTLSKGSALLIVFAGLMIATSISMLRKRTASEIDRLEEKHNYLLVLVEGVGVGFVTGLVGAGGGFLIIPALVLLAGLEMKLAIGTSLLIIAAKSLIGFLGDIQAGSSIDWPFLLIFSGFSIAGIFAGIRLTRSIDGEKLKKAFGWFVLVMGTYMVIREVTTVVY